MNIVTLGPSTFLSLWVLASRKWSSWLLILHQEVLLYRRPKCSIIKHASAEVPGSVRQHQLHVPLEVDGLRYFVIATWNWHSPVWGHRETAAFQKDARKYCELRRLCWAPVRCQTHCMCLSPQSRRGHSKGPPQLTWHWEVKHFLSEANFLGELGHPPEKTPRTGTRTRVLFFKRLKNSRGQMAPKAILFSFQFIKLAGDTIWKDTSVSFIFFGDEACFYL